MGSWRTSVSASCSSMKFSSHWFKVQIGTRAQYRVLQEPVLLNPNADWNLLPESSQSYMSEASRSCCCSAVLPPRATVCASLWSCGVRTRRNQVTKWRGRAGSQTFLLFHMRGRKRNRSTPAMQRCQRFIDQSIGLSAVGATTSCDAGTAVRSQVNTQ